ncbi:MAG TPA: CHAT domain-containing protein [Candidatus Limnocylindrales bacterium]|nr:CHAT domain-containing protein [Candidatus Limnocylindrales bacterium]
MEPPRLAQALGRLMIRRSGRIFFIVCGSALVGGLAFGSATFMQASNGGRAFFAVGMTLLAAGYFMIFLKLAILGFFPRKLERVYERLTGPVGALLFGVVSVTSAPTRLTTYLVVIFAAVMAIHLGVRGTRDVRAPLRTAVNHPRDTADARVMLELARSMRRNGLPPRERFLVELNAAIALVNLAESDDTYGRLHEAYDILVALTASPVFAQRQFRLSVADTLAEVSATLHRLGDDLRLYEQASLLLDQVLAEDEGVPDGRFRRLVNLSTLDLARAGIPPGTSAPDPTAVQMLRRSLENLRAAAPLAPRHRESELHNRLAICLAALADWTGERDLMVEAIAHARQALRAVRRVTREQGPVAQVILADLLMRRADDLGVPVEVSDLVEAEGLVAAVRSNRDPEVRTFGWFVHMGVVRRRRQMDPGLVDVSREIERIRNGILATPPYSRARLRLAALLAIWASEEEIAETAAWGYSEAVATARRLSATGLIRRQQQAAQYEIRGLAAEAAHWLLACGRPHEAVQVLESSRALVLGSAVNRERLVRQLERHDPALARRCAELSVKLAATDRAGPDEWGPTQLWAGLSDRRAARLVHDEWRRLTGSLGRWPEFRSLLDQPAYAAIGEAARHHPLVYLAAAGQRGYALMVEGGAARPTVVELPALTRTLAADLAFEMRDGSSRLGGPRPDLRRWRATLSAVLEKLREAVMEPMISGLGLTGTVILIPVGDLALLPLHVAAPERTEAAGITWCYAPSAQALTRDAGIVAAGGQTVGSPGRLLLVSSPGPAERRLRYATAIAPALARRGIAVTALAGTQARCDAVLAAAAEHRVYHFACHGVADPVDPLDSCLELDDGPLTMRDLLDRRLPARLAVLAACETSVAYGELPDEAVSLPAALLEAGVPGVIGTLWPVEELPTLLLTLRFYELWLGERSAPAVALQKAQHWLRTRTAADLASYLHDATGGSVQWPQTSIGRAAQTLTFAHPDHWAAFAYSGV